MDQQNAPIREITPGAVVTPPPAWADIEPYDAPAAANPHFVANGVCVLLDESQIDLVENERAWFYRRAELVTANTGAERVAQISISFDPAFERLEIHSIAVIRGEQRIEHADTAFFEVLRRERNMERLQFDGRLSVHVTLPDVRPGDIVEQSFTHYGMRKSLGGRHSAWVAFEWGVGIIDARVRLRRPRRRVVGEYALNNPPDPTETEIDGIIDRRWRAHERPAMRFEHLTPPWCVQNAALQFSEWRDWAEVAANYMPLYEDDGPLPADVEAEIARIAAEEPTMAGRSAAILRFTQDGVRYLAISMGEGGYTPRSLADIVATRYGDCKDKSKLYAHMARRLGVNACPALVNTRDGHSLHNWLASAQAFDHCIVRVEVDGKVYWLDPTRLRQPSPLDAMSQCHFGWALPLREGQATIERMADPSPVHWLEAHERVTLGPSPQAPVRYWWRLTSRRGRAESVRDYFATEGEVSVFRAYAESVQRTWPKAHPVQQAVTDDNHRANTITLEETYEIADAWKAADRTWLFGTLDLVMKPSFEPIDPGARKFPIYLGRIGKMSRRVEIECANEPPAGAWDRSVECDAIRFRNVMKRDGRKLIMEQSVETTSLDMPAADADKYHQIIAELERTDIVLNEATNKKGHFLGTREAQRDARGERLGFAAFILALAAIGYAVYCYFEMTGAFG
jgi:transglutaminase-like putative cysteine protease